jgi:hypothetical protein
MIIFGTDRNFYAVFTSWKGIHLRVYRVSHITILYPGSFHIHGKTLPGEYYIAIRIPVIQYFNTESTDATILACNPMEYKTVLQLLQQPVKVDMNGQHTGKVSDLCLLFLGGCKL